MGGAVSSLRDLDTVTKRLVHLSENDPNKEIFVFYTSGLREAYTARQLYTLAGRFAFRLRQRGFQKGDVIANTLNDSPERVVTDIGIMLAGCVTMNIQLLLADGSDFRFMAQNSKCRAVIMSPWKQGSAWKLMNPFFSGKSDQGFVDIHIDNIPDLTSAILVGRTENGENKHFLNDLKIGRENIYVEPAKPDDLLIIISTSGSTGYSKLVPRSHEDILKSEDLAHYVLSPGVQWNSPREKCLKYYNDKSMGWGIGIPFAPICSADTRVLTDIFDAAVKRTGKDLWEASTKENAQCCPMLCLEMDSVQEYIDSVGGSDFKFKMLIAGAQPLRKSQMENFLTLTEKLIVTYGSTEAGYLTAKFITKGDTIQSNDNGKVLPGVELRIVAEDGRLCRPGETGTIEVKGPDVFKGYYNRLTSPDPQTVKAFTSDGWFKMEDYGHIDEDGNVFVFGRTKDIIIYGADLLYPGWMEKKLMEHSDVLEAVVVPVSDPLLYQNICACVKIKRDSELNEDQLRKYCDQIFLPNLVTEETPKPQYFIITKGDFPETSTGKPNKKRLREMAESMFGYDKKVISSVAEPESET
ncbi:2-succinylbenzoate--CoA ligase [Biomphalaria pfeifferi]|uniref:2-succinylbenzoate--CoA ligase n=1 Tax=Biomphalaria pfeifferi TaxID=112525 RepID=A0AAD8C8T0_BIOPF|nr:2-succinylbenzoate--CoA ligase [Biomphalaria pfeifferi]